MKKLILFLLVNFILTSVAIAQTQPQKITFSVGATSPNPVFNYDSPADPSAYLVTQPITIDIILTDLPNLTQVNIISADKTTRQFKSADIAKFTTNGIVEFTINRRKPGAKALLTFPITIEMIYKGQTISSSAIGAAPAQVIATSPVVQTPTTLTPASPVITPADPTKVTAPVTPTIAKLAYTGSAYGDALTIKLLIAQKDSAALLKLMSDYYSPVLTNLGQLHNAIKNNAFLELALGGLKKSDFNLPGGQGNSGFGSAVNAVSGIDVTNIANGITEFMIKRAKEELTIAFFNKFETFANNHPAFSELFPQTTKNLSHLLSYSYPSMLPALRSGFNSDLNALPGNIGNVLNDTSIQKFLQNYPEVSVAVRAIYLADQVASKNLSINDALKNLATCTEFKNAKAGSEFKNLANAINLMYIISNSLIEPAQTNVSGNWITADEFKAMSANGTLLLYLGLLEQTINAANITFTNGTATIPLAPQLDKLEGDIAKAQSVINDFLQVTATADQLKNDIIYKKNNHIAVTKDDINNYVNQGLTLVDMGFDMAAKIDADIKPGTYEPILKDAVAVYQNVSNADYPQAVVNTIDLLSVSIDLKGANATAEIKNLQSVVNDINKYGLFIANMINAKSGDDVESVIESTVLPVGSSSVKKNSSFNFAVQSYLGVHYLTGAPKLPVQSAWGDNFGVSAPIGLSVSYGLKKWGSVSFFGSLFDLGAIADYQLKTDSAAKTTTKDYQVKLGQIVSPGAFLVYGIGGNIPLSVGFGYQYGPGLGKINTDGTTVVNNPSGRWQIFLSVDIPLFNLVNHSYTGAAVKSKSQ